MRKALRTWPQDAVTATFWKSRREGFRRGGRVAVGALALLLGYAYALGLHGTALLGFAIFLGILLLLVVVATPLLGALAALTRPEGLVFAAVLTTAASWTALAGARDRPVYSPGFLARGLYVLLPILAGAGQFLLYKLLTGTGAADGVQVKSLLCAPILYPTEVLARIMTNLRELDTRVLTGFDGYLFPGAVVFSALGAAWLVFRGGKLRTFALAVVLALALSVVYLTTFSTWGMDHYRYFMPFLPILTLPALSSCPSASLAALIGTAKPMPLA